MNENVRFTKSLNDIFGHVYVHGTYDNANRSSSVDHLLTMFETPK